MNFQKNSIKLGLVGVVNIENPVTYEQVKSAMEQVAREHDANMEFQCYRTIILRKDGKDILSIENFLDNGNTGTVYYNMRDGYEQNETDESMEARLNYLLKNAKKSDFSPKKFDPEEHIGEIDNND